jgi:hypothetical protein
VVRKARLSPTSPKSRVIGKAKHTAETRRTAQVRISEQGDGAAPHDPPVIETARKQLAKAISVGLQ